jgi:hypothetical protein
VLVAEDGVEEEHVEGKVVGELVLRPVGVEVRQGGADEVCQDTHPAVGRRGRALDPGDGVVAALQAAWLAGRADRRGASWGWGRHAGCCLVIESPGLTGIYL